MTVPWFVTSLNTLHDVHQDAEDPGEEEHRQRVRDPRDEVGGGGRGEGHEQRRPVAAERGSFDYHKDTLD